MRSEKWFYIFYMSYKVHRCILIKPVKNLFLLLFIIILYIILLTILQGITLLPHPHLA